MIGAKKELLTYVNVSMQHFLDTLFDNASWLYWTGELSEFEQQLNLKPGLFYNTSLRNNNIDT